MTAADLAAYVGQHGMLRVATGSAMLDVPVVILDAREVYGRIDVLVDADPTPDRGSITSIGTWVSADRVKVGKP